MGSVVLAWLAGQGIIWYRTFRDTGGPPMPGQLLAATGLYVALAVVADNEDTRLLAQAGAWGFTAAAWLALYNKQEPQPAQRRRPAAHPKTRPQAGPAPANPIVNT